MKTKILLPLLVLVILSNACQKSPEEADYKIIAVKLNDKWGYMNRHSKLVIDTLYEEASSFINGIACVSTDKKFGYIRENGKVLIQPQFKNASIFSEDLACIVMENQFPSYINKNGEIQFTVQHAEFAGLFKEGLAPVQIKSKWGFINKNGEVVIKPQYEDVTYFKDGLSVFSQNQQNKRVFGYMNKKGEPVIKATFVSAYPFSEGVALVKQDSLWEFIDPNGKSMFSGRFKTAFPFSEGLALVQKDSLFGYIDKTGEFTIKPQFRKGGSFHDGLALCMQDDSLYGYINPEGVFEIKPAFKNSGSFSKEISYFTENEKYGFIDTKGNKITDPIYDDIFVSDNFNRAIESDFFNIGELMNIFLKNTNSTMFRKVSAETTLESIAEDIHTGSDITVPSDTVLHIDEPIIIDEHTEISGLDYFFGGKIYKEIYSYYGGSNRKYLLETKVSGMEYTLNLTDRASTKYLSVKNALVERVSDLLNAEPVKAGENDIIVNQALRIEVGIQKVDNKDRLRIRVKFL